MTHVAYAQGRIETDESEQWISATSKTYTARNLHLNGRVKRVVQYDSLRVEVGTPAAETQPPKMFLDSSVWEFSQDGDVLSTLEHGDLEKFYRTNNRIDSVVMMISKIDPELCMHKHYDEHGRLSGMRMVANVVGQPPVDAFRAEVARAVNGDVDSITVFQYGGGTMLFRTEPTAKRNDNLQPTTIAVHQPDGDVVAEYATDASEHLRELHVRIATAGDTQPKDTRTVFDSVGAVLRKEVQNEGNQFVEVYTYGSQGEMTSYHTEMHRAGDASGTRSTTIHYKYTFDSHGNWTLRTIEGLLPDDAERASNSSEIIPRIERHIEYW